MEKIFFEKGDWCARGNKMYYHDGEKFVPCRGDMEKILEDLAKYHEDFAAGIEDVLNRIGNVPDAQEIVKLTKEKHELWGDVIREIIDRR